MTTRNSTARFSDRASQYDLYRPTYPAEIITHLQQTIGLNKQWVIADIGSGTGISSALFLNAGNAVCAIEPNAEMRAMAVKKLGQYENFTAIAGTAEQTSLRESSVDLIVVAQAFHWFNLAAVRKEFARILKPGGYVLLVWNMLQTNTPFLQAYAAVKEKYAEKNAHPDHANLENIRGFFAPRPVVTHQLRNIQWRDADGLKGLLTSSSKVPLPSESHYTDMMNGLEILARQYADNGLLKLEYETMLYIGTIDDLAKQV